VFTLTFSASLKRGEMVTEAEMGKSLQSHVPHGDREELYL
jgi:hypothetical protein